MKKITVLLGLVVALAGTAKAESLVNAEFKWAANPVEENITGYTLYSKFNAEVKSPVFIPVEDLTDKENPTWIIEGLETPGEWCFQLSASNSRGESPKTESKCKGSKNDEVTDEEATSPKEFEFDLVKPATKRTRSKK